MIIQSFVLTSLLFFLGHAAIFREERRWSPIVPRQTASVNVESLLEAQKQNRGFNHFQHSKELFRAVHQGQKMFEAAENVDTTNEIGGHPSYSDITSTAKYNATATYKMFHSVNYLSLDDPTVQSRVREISAHAISFCGDASAGDFIVGSVDGDWMKMQSTAQWRQHTLSDNGLVFSRVVESAEPLNVDQTSCLNLRTRDVPAIKLFEHFRIESLSELPFSHYDFAPRSGPKTKSFSGDGPDPPAVACTDHTYWDDDDYKQTHAGADDDYTVVSGYGGLSNGCASINVNLLSLISGETFNYNYNPTTGGAQSSISLGSGLTCANCFAYIGVYIYAVMEYWDTAAEMAFEAKLDGGLGFNIQISADNPTVSASVTIPLVPATPNTVLNLPLGFGLSMTTSFGGLNAVISGSGSATGTADMGTGANANAYIGVEYDYLSSSEYGFTFPYSAEFSVTPPYFSPSSDFQIDSLSLTAELDAIQDFTLQYTYLDIELLGADFSVVFAGSAEYSNSASSVASSSLAITATLPSSSSATVTALASSSLPTVSPGNVIPITVQVDGFNPGEETMLYFSFHREDFASQYGVSIFKTKFVVPPSGSAAVSVDWLVPWDTRMLQKTSGPASTPFKSCSISVHASNLMSKVVNSQAFAVVADTTVDGLITSPADGAVLTAGTSVPVTWGATSLRFFDKLPGNSGLGDVKHVESVVISLVREDSDASTGAIVSSTAFSLTPEAVPNTGTASVVIPTTVLPPADSSVASKYFLVLHSAKYNNLKGWSAGYVTVEAPSSTSAVPAAALVSAEATAGDAVSLTNVIAPRMNAKKVEQKLLIGVGARGRERMGGDSESLLPPIAPRELSSTCGSCTDGDITFTATVDGTLTSVTVGDIPFSVGLSSGAVNVLPVTCECASNSPAPAPAPGPPSPSPGPGPPTPATVDDQYSHYYSYFAIVDGNTLAPTPAIVVVSSSSAAPALSLSVGAIAGVVVGSLMCLGLVALAIARRWKASKGVNNEQTKNVELQHPSVVVVGNVADDQPLDFAVSPLQVQPDADANGMGTESI